MQLKSQYKYIFPYLKVDIKLGLHLIWIKNKQTKSDNSYFPILIKI